MIRRFNKILLTALMAAGMTFSANAVADSTRGVIAKAGECYYGQPSVAGGDVTGDGLDDIVTGDREGIFLIENLGKGKFSEKKLIAKPGELAYAQPRVAIGDLTGDGKNDILFANTYDIMVCENTGNGKFIRPYKIANAGSLKYGQPSIAISDVDKNDLNDVIVGNRDGIIVYLNNGDRTFRPIW